MENKTRKGSIAKFGEWKAKTIRVAKESQNPFWWCWLGVGADLPPSPSRWTARILRMGLLWSHWFISPDTWTNRKCSFNLEFPWCRERWNWLLLYDKNASPLMVNPSFPLLLGGSCAALDPGYNQNALDSGKYVEEAFMPLWTQRYFRHG